MTFLETMLLTMRQTKYAVLKVNNLHCDTKSYGDTTNHKNQAVADPCLNFVV